MRLTIIASELFTPLCRIGKHHDGCWKRNSGCPFHADSNLQIILALNDTEGDNMPLFQGRASQPSSSEFRGASRRP